VLDAETLGVHSLVNLNALSRVAIAVWRINRNGVANPTLRVLVRLMFIGALRERRRCS
jgi:hypothetical protein